MPVWVSVLGTIVHIVDFKYLWRARLVVYVGNDRDMESLSVQEPRFFLLRGRDDNLR